MADRITKLAIKDIQPNPHNLRGDLTDIAELASSIAFMGLLQPIRVDKDGKIIAGHRRREALDYLIENYDDWDEDTVVPCIVGNKLDESGETAAMLIENMQRVDLEITEQVEGVRRLMQEYGWTQTQVADNLGVTKKWVSDRVHIQNTPLEAFQQERPMSIEVLAQFGQLPEDVQQRLVKKEAISQYDVEDRFQKMKSEEKMERQLRKLQKDGYIATTEAEVKRLIKHDGTDLEPYDQLIKTSIGPAEQVGHFHDWESQRKPTLVLKQLFMTIEEAITNEKVGKSDLLVASKQGGFWRWYTTKLVKPKGEPAEGERDWERERREAAEQEAAHRAAVITKMHNKVEDTKPAELTTNVMWDMIRTQVCGFNPFRKVVEMSQVLGLDVPEKPEIEEKDWDAERAWKNEVLPPMVDAITSYAGKNNSTLARTAAAAAMVSTSDEELVEDWGLDIEVENDKLTPLETGI